MARYKLITPQERSEITDQIQERVDELTFPELAKMTQKEKNKELSQIKNTLKDYLTKYAIAEKKVLNASQSLNLTNGQNKNLQMYILYKTLLTTDITNLLKDGYILIEKLRYTFTSEEIIYEVGMEYSVKKGSSKQIINKIISLAELLSYAAPDIQWRGVGMSAFKLRAKSYKSDFDAEYQKYKDALAIELNNAHSLWPRVQNIINSNYGKKQNLGNIYEVYRGLQAVGYASHPPGPRDPQDLTVDEVIERFMDIRKGTQSFVSGGDRGLVQNKLLSAAPSIASLNTIGDALKLILSYLEKGEKADITIEHIKNNVFSGEFDKRTRTGLQDMIEEVSEELSLEISDK